MDDLERRLAALLSEPSPDDPPPGLADRIHREGAAHRRRRNEAGDGQVSAAGGGTRAEHERSGPEVVRGGVREVVRLGGRRHTAVGAARLLGAGVRAARSSDVEEGGLSVDNGGQPARHLQHWSNLVPARSGHRQRYKSPDVTLAAGDWLLWRNGDGYRLAHLR